LGSATHDSHIALRTRHAERCSQFYADVFGLTPLDRPKDGNFYLSDGRVTLMIIPWKITDYYAQDPAHRARSHRLQGGVGRPGEKDMEFLIGENPHMRTRALVTARRRSAPQAVPKMPSQLPLTTSKASTSTWGRMNAVITRR